MPLASTLLETDAAGFLIAILFFAVFGAIYLVYDRLADKASEKINQKVFARGSYEKQKELQNQVFNFHTSLAPEEFIDRLEQRIVTANDPGDSFVKSMGTRFEIDEKRPDCLELLLQRVKMTIASAFVSAERASDGHTEVFFTITEWTEQGGIMVGIKEFNRLRATVQEVANETSPDPQGQGFTV